MSCSPIDFGSPGIPVVTGQISLSRRAKPLEILGRPSNDVLISREFRESLDFCVTVDQKRLPCQWRSTASDGHQRCVSMVIRDVCPRCKSPKYKKNGHIHSGKQNHQCCGCGRQFVQCFEQYLITEDKRGLIERLLVERISLRGICRAVGVKLKWLLGFLIQCVEALPDHLHVHPITYHSNIMMRRLEVEADEMARFVQKKAHKHG